MNDLMKNYHFGPTKAGQLHEVQFRKTLLGLKIELHWHNLFVYV